MNWEYKRLCFRSQMIHDDLVKAYRDAGWEVQSHATGPERKYITVMKRLNPKAVDRVFNDGCLFLESPSISEEDRRKAIQVVARRYIKNHGLTTHQACQEIAIEMGYSYECIREIIDDDQGS